MSDDEPEAVAEPLERPSWEALTEAFAPGSTPGRVAAIFVDQHNNVTEFFLLMPVAGREALVECSVGLATYTRRGRGQNRQESRSRSRRRWRPRRTRQQEPPAAAAAAAEVAKAVQQPSSRDAPPDGLDWALGV